ncbi:MAG: helix-turn-helix domain-containing protein, partial [Candidatus Omnitrophica bacterium]|nr:helix-turn-helix domain-containing protein [Candidatus Omnitrophota bacterium]
MAGKDTVTMSQEELRRISIIHKALDRRVTQIEAASILSLSDRQIRRIIKRVKREGDEGII